MKETTSISGALLVLTAIFQTSSANPVGGNVTVGSATITQNGDILSVVTGSNKTVIDWDSFSISAGQLTQIMQPGANSATLNRVVGTMPSELLGTLMSNGKVALINENGILVGNTGIIDTHGFIGSTLNTTNEAFLANGNMVFSGGSEASIVNQGTILARQGDVFLLGRNVTNAGSIEAQNGNAGLAAGGEIVLRKASDEHVYVEVKSSSRGDKVVNSGTIKAIQDDLHHNGGNPYQYAMNTGDTGVNNIQVRPGGGVYLNAGTEGSVVHSGAIKAVKGDKGGDVALSGRTVDVKSGSKIDASGAKGGGTVKVGGGFKGKDGSITNSKATRVEQGAEIKADATENGKGGQVVVWSDGATSYAGSISAKGAGAGSGGSAEVSGKEYLDFRGEADLTAANGHKGDLLLDPANITIQASNPDIAGNGTNNDIANAADLDDANLDFPGANSVITTGAVANLLLTSNLTLAATNDITVSDPLAYASLFNLTLDAGHDILVNGAISNTLIGGINLTAGHDITVNAGITSVVAGTITLSAGNDITVGNSISTLGTVALNFGQTEGGTLTFGAGGSVVSVLGATATGGAGDDTVAFTSSPANNIAIDLAGGSNTVKLTAGNDSIGLTAANAVTFGSATITGVTNVDGDGGANSVVLTAGDDVFSVTGARAGSGFGIALTNIDSVDGGTGNNTLNNTSAAAFDAATNSVNGVAVTNFQTVDTAALDLTTGDDVFTVTGANAGSFDGIAYTGLNTVNGLGGSNEVDLTAGDDSFAVTGANAGSGAGIGFTGLSKVDGLGGNNTLSNTTGTAYDGAGNSVAGVSAVGFSTVDTAALNLSTGDDAFSVTGANQGTYNGTSFTGLTNVAGNGGNDTVTNSTGLAFEGGTMSVDGVTVTGFGTVNTAVLNLTAGNDTFSIIPGGGKGLFNGVNFTGLTTVNALGGSDLLANGSGTSFSTETMSAAGVATTGFETVSSSSLKLTAGDDVIQVIGGSNVSIAGVSYIGVSSVDALGGVNTVNLPAGPQPFFANLRTGSYGGLGFTNIDKVNAFDTGAAFNSTVAGTYDAATNSVNGITISGFGTVHVTGLNLTAGDDTFTVTGSGTGDFGTLHFNGLTTVDGLGGNDTLINGTSLVFNGGAGSVAGITTSGFENVQTASLALTTGDDAFSITGTGTGSFLGINYSGLSSVDALGGNDVLTNSSGVAFEAGTMSGAGVAVTGFETINTPLLNLTTGDDIFVLSAAGKGQMNFQPVTYTGLTHVDGLGGSNTFLNQTPGAFAVETMSAGGVSVSNFGLIGSSQLTLTSGDDDYQLYGGSMSSMNGISYVGVTHVDGLGGTNTVHVNNPAEQFSVTGTRQGRGEVSAIVFDNLDSVVGSGLAGSQLNNHTALAFDGGTSSVAGVSVTGFALINTSLLNLSAGDDLFTLTGAGTGTFGTQAFSGLTQVDGLGGTDTFVNNSGVAFDGGTTSAAGVSAVNFETVQTALLNLTAGDDVFTVNGANAGSFLGLNYTGLTSVDGLGGNDTLVNATALAFDAATNSVAGVAETNFETVNTALLTLTAGDDLFTVTGANAGTFETLNFTGLSQVDGLGGSNTLVNGTALAFEASTLSVSGVTAANFGTVNTALLNLTTGDDVFALTGSGTGSFAGISYTGLTSVDALGGSNTVALTGGDDSFTVTGTRAGTGSAVAFTNLDKVDGAGGSDTLVNGTALAFEGSTNSVAGVTETNFETVSTDKLNLTAGDDSFTVTGSNAGTFGGLNFINLTQVDGLAGSDTLVNSTPGAFDGATNTVAGVTQSNFETVSTALLTLTTGDDLFTVTEANSGTFGGLSFINLTQVDALAGNDTITLTAGDDALTVTGTGAVATSGIALNHVEAVDGGTGVNGITLTAGDDVFTAGGTRAGSGLGIAFTNIDSINGGGGTDTYVGTSGADIWSITGTNAGSLLGASFSGFSQLRSGGTAVDTFNFAAGGDVTGFISGTDGGNGNLAALAFTNSGVATNLTGSVRANGLRLASTSGGSFTLLNAGNDIATLAANLDGALNFRNGSAFTVGTVDGATGLTTTGDAITLDTAAGGITLAADVSSGSTAAGDITLNQAVTLAASTAVTGGNVAFNDTVNGSFGLTVNSGGATTFAGAVGGSSALTSLITDAGGTTALNGGAVTTSGAQIYGDTVTLGAPASVFTGDSVTFAASLDGASATTVNAVTTLFGGAVGNGTALTSLTTDASGVTTVSGGSIRTSGAQVFNDAVTLGSATSVFSGAAVTFASTLNGASDTTVNATTTTFGGEVGGVVALNSLTTDAGGSLVIQGPAVRTTGAQNYGDDVSLTNATTIFSGSGVTFGAKLDGASAVTVNATDTIFNGAVGSGTALASLTTDAAGTTQINGGSIVTSGAQLYSDAVSLGADTLLQGGSLDFVSIAAAAHNLALHAATTISLGDTLNATKLNLEAGGNVTQKAGSKLAIGELSGDTHGKTVLFNPDNQIVTIGNFNAGGDLLIFDSGTSGGGAAYGMNVTGHVNGQGSVWLVEGSGGLKVDPGASVSVDGLGNGLLLVGGLDLALGIPGSGELVLKGNIDLTNGARGFLVMNSIGLNGGSDLTGARHLIKSLNFSFDPTLPLVFGDALRTQATVGPLDYNQLSDVIASKLPNPVLGPLTAAVFQSPKPDTDSASQISDIVALVRGFFNDLDTGDEKVTNDASAIVEIGKMARFESGVYPPAYGPFALTSYEYEWWLQEKNGQVKDKDMFYHRRYPLYLKQKGKGPDGRPDYESILEDR